MTSHALNDVWRGSQLYEPRKSRMAQVMEAQRLTIGENGDLIADRMPADGTRQVAGIERAALDPGEHMIEVVRGQPRLQLIEDRHGSHPA